MSCVARKPVFGVSEHINHPENPGLSDKTAKFQKCPANFVSLPDSMSDEKLIQKKAQTVFLGDGGLQLMKIAHISCIFFINFAVFTKCGKTST